MTAQPHKKRSSLVELIQLSDLFLLKLCIALSLLCLLLFSWGMLERYFKNPTQYYEILDETKFRRMQALRTPNLSTQTVLAWAMEAATAAYRFNFYDYPNTLKTIRPYFTEAGYEHFINTLSTRILPVIRQKKLVLTSVVTDTPTILMEGPTVGGVYAWEIQFPMLLTYESQSDRQYQRTIVTLLIAEVPTTESSKGIGIASFTTGELSR